MLLPRSQWETDCRSTSLPALSCDGPTIQEWPITASSSLPSTVPRSSGPGPVLLTLFPQALLLLTCSKTPPLNHSLLSSHWLWKPGHCMPLDSFQEIFKHHLVLMVWGRKQVLYIHFLVEMEIPAQSKLWWRLDGLVLRSEYYCLPVVLQADHSDNHQQRDESSNVKTHSMHLCPMRRARICWE